jgi:phospholipid/cholesterol/gamma-HCH transport system permease protein
MREAIEQVGGWCIESITRLGYAARFFCVVLQKVPFALRRFRLVVDQIHFIGNYSLLIILVSGLFIGFVLGLQGYYTLTGLLYAGRAGTSLTAEIGLMKAGEQLSAMEMMAVDPLARVFAPRFIAGVIAMPVLSVLFSAIGIFGAYLIGVRLVGVDAGAFWSQMQAGVDVVRDIGNGVLKTIVFGVAVTFIALYQGFESDPTPEGVSRATTRTVVSSWLLASWACCSCP